MKDGDVLVVTGEQVRALLNGREREVLDCVDRAYRAHGRGESVLPHSSFLRFPGESSRRIISLAAYLGGEFSLAGIKWIASFPENVGAGIDRASAVMILNSPDTGRPYAVLESSIVSAKRTAASAAVATRVLLHGVQPERVGIVGGGVINFETVRYLIALLGGISELLVYDTNRGRAEFFLDRCRAELGVMHADLADSGEAVLESCALTSVATTATQPHFQDLKLPPDTVVLHLSLRDFTPDMILQCNNVVDDIDHVCRADTSIHLAEKRSGSRDFINAALPDLIEKPRAYRLDKTRPVIFSPFGLGVLDIAVGQMVYDLILQFDGGIVINSFLPVPWRETAETCIDLSD